MDRNGVVCLADRIGPEVGHGAFSRRFVFLGGSLRGKILCVFDTVRAHDGDDESTTHIKNGNALGTGTVGKEFAAIPAHGLVRDKSPGPKKLLCKRLLLASGVPR